MSKTYRKTTSEESAKFGRMGGKTTLKKYGVGHFKSMAEKGNASIRRKYGADYYKNLAQKGVEARLKKQAKNKK